MKLIKNFINGVAKFIRKHFIISLIAYIILITTGVLMSIYHKEIIFPQITCSIAIIGFIYFISNKTGIYMLSRRIFLDSFKAYERNEKYERIQGVITAICFLISSTLFLACAITIGIYEIFVMN